MAESRMVGVRRAPDLDAKENNGEVWVASHDLDDLLLSDSEFLPAESWEGALAELEARYPPPDPELYRVVKVGSTYVRHAADLPPRIIVLKGWYWHMPADRRDRLARLEELAQAFGPILIWRNRINSWRDSDACAAVRGWAGYSDRSLVVRDWYAGRDDRSRDPVVAYEPKRAAAREKGQKTREERARREGLRALTYNGLSNRRSEFVAAVRKEVEAELARHLKRTRLRALGAHVFADRDSRPPGDPPFAGWMSSDHAVTASVNGLRTGSAGPDLAFAIAVYRAVFRNNKYRDLPQLGQLLDAWRGWPESVDRKDVPTGLAELLDAEVAAARRRRPRKPKAAPAPGPAAEEAA